jgi:alpha-1,2-mannosyltransferase
LVLKTLLIFAALVGVILFLLIELLVTKISLKSLLNTIVNANNDYQIGHVSLWVRSLVIISFFVTCAVIIEVALRLVFNYNNLLTTYYSVYFFLHTPYTDSWYVMVKALEHFDGLPGESVYEALILKDTTKFQYPPSSLLIFDIPKRFLNLSYDQLVDMFNKISWACIPLLAIIFYSLLNKSAHHLSENDQITLPDNEKIKPEGRKSKVVWIALFVSAISVGTFYPILWSYQIGQIQTIMTMLTGLSLLAWQAKRYGIAGVLLSICCSFKPQWVVLVPWAIIRKQWSFLISFSITSTAIFLITGAFYGFKNWIDYVKVLSLIGRVGESYVANQSVNGLLHRLFMNGNNLEVTTNAFPPYHPTVYMATLITSILILGLAMLWKRNKTPSLVEFAIVILSLTMASPVAWVHHYAVVYLFFALVIPLTFIYKPLGKWSFVYLLVTYLLVSQNYGYIFAGLAKTHFNFLQSTIFLGIIMMLFYLYKLSQKQYEKL